VGNEWWNGFYIPLDPDYNGTFGVTDVPAGGPIEGKAGKVSDNGNGSLTSLDMYMFFDDFEHPTAAASLLFLFKDLDLESDNTPSNLFETVQFSTAAGDFTGVLDTHGNGANYWMFGGNDFRAIFFPDVVSLITSSSLTVKLNFTGDGYGQNTKEKIKGVLLTKPAPPIPEPSTMILLGLGLAGLVMRKRLAGQKS
jgi:prepilin-type processing-associated H-X9-DG protein